MCIRLDTIPEYGRVTDWQTNGFCHNNSALRAIMTMTMMTTSTLIRHQWKWKCSVLFIFFIRLRPLVCPSVSWEALGSELREFLSLWRRRVRQSYRLYVVRRPLSWLDRTQLWPRRRRMPECNTVMRRQLRLREHQRIVHLYLSPLVPATVWERRTMYL